MVTVVLPLLETEIRSLIICFISRYMVSGLECFAIYVIRSCAAIQLISSQARLQITEQMICGPASIIKENVTAVLS